MKCVEAYYLSRGIYQSKRKMAIPEGTISLLLQKTGNILGYVRFRIWILQNPKTIEVLMFSILYNSEMPLLIITNDKPRFLFHPLEAVFILQPAGV